VAGPLDRCRERSLPLRGCSSHALGKDLSPFGDETLEQFDILEVDMLDFVLCEVADLAAFFETASLLVHGSSSLEWQIFFRGEFLAGLVERVVVRGRRWCDAVVIISLVVPAGLGFGL